MRKITKHALLLIASISMIVSCLAISGTSSAAQAGVPDGTIQYSHEPIRVDNDSQLDDLFAAHPQWNGTGTGSDPYIIENQFIDAAYYGCGIFMGNLSHNYLIIRNCTIYGAAIISGVYSSGTDIVLCNTTNVLVLNNWCYGSAVNGIKLLDGCTGNLLVGNNCSDNPNCGILVSGSDDNVILGNNCSNNADSITPFHGIGIDNSDYNLVLSNTCNNNLFAGIYLGNGADNNMVAGNTCNGNTIYSGVHVSYSDFNDVVGNVCLRNGHSGVYLAYAAYNDIVQNNCSENWFGIYFLYSSYDVYNNITDNFCYDNMNDGISVGDDSTGTSILRNTCIGNEDYGITVHSSSNVHIENNTCDWNEYGIEVVNIPYSDIMNNTCRSNTIGVRIDNLDGGNISNNVCVDNGQGIQFFGSSIYNHIENNTCTSNDYCGINVEEGSNYNLLANNTCTENGQMGIRIGSSSFNTIIYNNCSDNFYVDPGMNPVAGIRLEFSHHNVIAHNVCNWNVNFLGTDDASGIALFDSDNNRVENNTCHGNSLNGIFLSYDSDYSYYSEDNIIKNNTCGGNPYGIYLMDHSYGTVIADNVLDDNIGMAIYVFMSNGSIIERNTVSTSLFDGGVIFIDRSSGLIISNNTVVSNGAGIFFFLSSAYVDGNELTGCSFVFEVDGAYTSNKAAIDATTITATNTVDGLPVYFLKNANMNNASVPAGRGEVMVYNVTNLVIEDLDLGVGGVYVCYCSNVIVEHITTDNSLYGALLYYCRNCVVNGSEFANTIYDGIHVGSSSYCNVTENTIMDGLEVGIFINNSNRLNVLNNTIDECNEGIVTWNAPLNHFIGNDISDCAVYGMSLRYSSSNSIYGNSFINNNGATYVYDADHIQAFDDSTNSWSVGGSGNFWSDWTGPDMNRDGIVDQAYRVDGGRDVALAVGVPTPPGPSVHVYSYDYYPLALAIEFIDPTSPAYTNVSSIDVVGNTSSYYDVTEITWYNLWNGQHGTCTMVSGTNNWTATFLLTEGINWILVNATDEFGNTATKAYIAYYDTVDPFVTIVRPAEGWQFALDMVSVAWRAGDTLSGVDYSMVSVDGGEWVKVYGSHYIIEGLSDGEHTVQVKVFDRAGNSNLSQVVSFLVDTTGPAVEITSPEDGSYSLDSDVTVQWTSTDLVDVAYYMVRVDGLDWVRVDGTNYTFVGLADGAHAIVVGAYDALGNYAEASVVVIVDTVEPTVVVSPEGDEIDIDAIVIAQFSKPMKTMDVWIVGVAGFGTASVDRVTFTPEALEYNREYTVVLSGEDLAGHVVNVTWTFSTMIKVGDVKGQIVDANGKPLANVTVTLSNGATTRTNAEGRFVFADVDQGSYNVTFSKDGYVTGNATAVVIADETDDLGKIKLATTPKAANNDALIIVAIVAGAIGVIVVAALLMRRKP